MESLEQLSPQKLEKTYVLDTYQAISKTFSHTRSYLWKSVIEFLAMIPKWSILLEVGCGNGRNLVPRKSDMISMGVDLCPAFAEITYHKGLDTILANNLTLPYRSNSVDYILSIAVIHHLATPERRRNAIIEMLRVLKKGGKMLLQVWAMEQPAKSRRKFTQQDNLVKFQNSTKTMTHYRFYHIYRKNELEQVLWTIPGITILKSFWEVGNWVVVLEKTE